MLGPFGKIRSKRESNRRTREEVHQRRDRLIENLVRMRMTMAGSDREYDYLTTAIAFVRHCPAKELPQLSYLVEVARERARIRQTATAMGEDYASRHSQPPGRRS